MSVIPQYTHILLTGCLYLKPEDVMDPEFPRTCDYFQMHQLRDLVFQYVQPSTGYLSFTNLLTWHDMAKRHNWEEMIKRCEEMFSVCYKQVTQEQVNASGDSL